MKDGGVRRTPLGGQGRKQFEFAEYFTDSNAIKKSESLSTCMSASCFIKEEADLGEELMTTQFNCPLLGSPEWLGWRRLAPRAAPLSLVYLFLHPSLLAPFSC